MAQLVSPDQLEAALVMYQDGVGKLKSANATQLPYDLLDWMLQQEEKNEKKVHQEAIQTSEFAKLREQDSLPVLERIKRLNKALMTELEFFGWPPRHPAVR